MTIGLTSGLIGSLTATMLAASFAHGAISKKNAVRALLSKDTARERIAGIRKNPDIYKELRNEAFDESLPFQIRWRALMSMAFMGGPLSIPELEIALQHKDWFMRDAGLKAIEKIDAARARTWGRKLISDSALVVRTTAVQVLHRLADKGSEGILWQKLFSTENYRGQQSLWVRHHIVAALGDLSSTEKTGEFVQLLDDGDPKVTSTAVAILEKRSGKTFGQDVDVARVELKKWWAQKSGSPIASF